MSIKDPNDLGFTFKQRKNGDVLISHHGSPARMLHNKKAFEFSEKIVSLSFTDQQQLMARLTGNYKRGNERVAKDHPRNRE